MAEDVVSIDDTARLTDAIRVLDEHRFGVLPVVDSQNVVIGILSTTDLIEIFHEIQSDLGALHIVNESTRDFLIQMLTDQGDNTLVRDVMTSPVQTIPVGTNLVVAAQMLHGKKYHHLPVVDDDGLAVGMLSASDFVRVIATHGASLAG